MAGVALLLRVLGLNFGLPAIYRPDENVAVGRAMGLLRGVLDPHFADWPHLFFNLSALWLAPGALLGLVHDQPSAHLWVRALSAVLGTASVLLVIEFGRRAFGWSAGLIAGAGLAVAFLAVRDSHFGTPDTALALTITGALYLAYRSIEARGVKALLLNGVALGLAASLKYNGAFVLLSAAAGQGLRAVANRGTRATFISRTAVIAAVGILTLALTSPFLLLDPAMTGHGLGYIFSHLASETVDQIGFIRLLVALWYGLDPGLFALALAGVVYAAWRRTAADWVLLAFVIPYYLVIGAGHSVFFRYADPLIAPLALLAGRLANELVTSLAKGKLRTPALVALIAAVVIPALVHDLRFDTLIQQPDTRTLAYQWLDEHVALGGRVAIPYKPGPAHDQALVDSGTQSLGATDPYVASFLENRLETRYTVHDLSEEELQGTSISVLLQERIAYVVIARKRPDLGCASPTPLERQLQQQASLVASFSPTGSGCPAGSLFDTIDTYYVPLAGYAGFVRPGPVIRIYALRD